MKTGNHAVCMLALSCLPFVGCADTDDTVSVSDQANGDEVAPVQNSQAQTVQVNKHCAMLLPEGKVDCFATEREALALASGGRITDGPIGPTDAKTEELLAERINAAGKEAKGSILAPYRIIGKLWKDWDYSGSSLTYYSIIECDVYLTPEFQVDFTFLNDAVSSFQGYNGCWLNLWQHMGCVGLSTGWSPAISRVVDPMNDQGSCVQIS